MNYSAEFITRFIQDNPFIETKLKDLADNWQTDYFNEL